MQTQTWIERINGILARHNGKRANGRVASVQTQNTIKATVLCAFRDLHKLGFKITNPQNLSQRHLFSLLNYWWYERHIAASTLNNRLSRLRRFSSMIGKAGLVRTQGYYLPKVPVKDFHYSAHALVDKSWSACGINLPNLFKKLDKQDRNLSLILRMALAFGLRREEAIKCRPHIQDHEHWFHVLHGQGKGGRERIIRIITPAQREILNIVKSYVGRNDSLGWTDEKLNKKRSLKSNLKLYIQKLELLGFSRLNNGVTGHGLRSQFAQNRAILCGVIPPFFGGTYTQMPSEEMDMRLMQLSEDLGHHRKAVMSAYLGAFAKTKAINHYVQEVLAMALSFLPAQIETVEIERLNDCLEMQRILDSCSIDASLSQIQFLWSIWCERNGVYWYRANHEVTLALACSAWQFMHTDSLRNRLSQTKQKFLIWPEHHGSGI